MLPFVARTYPGTPVRQTRYGAVLAAAAVAGSVAFPTGVGGMNSTAAPMPMASSSTATNTCQDAFGAEPDPRAHRVHQRPPVRPVTTDMRVRSVHLMP